MEAVFIPQEWEREDRIQSPSIPPLPTRTPSPSIDYRALDYVSTYDEHLECPICRCPYIDPVNLLGCDHFFCRECIKQTWSQNYSSECGDCPTCRRPTRSGLGAPVGATKIIISMIDDLQVHCPQSEEGCTSVIKRGELHDHLKLYCGYNLVDCTAADCTHQMRRKDVPSGCNHYLVSCGACRAEMLVSELESHWTVKCANTLKHCHACDADVSVDEFSQHRQQTCPASPCTCPGQTHGCHETLTRAALPQHVESCVFARLGPIFTAQQQRLAEQERAQSQMSRKLELLEQGFSNIQQLLNPRPTQSSTAGAHESSSSRQDSMGIPQQGGGPNTLEDYTVGSRFDSTAQPFISPIHHLLSMNESLQSEVSRLSTAIIELDGRQSMHTLNENLRTRDELAYLGGQVAGISRQVQWLTSAQLQRTPDASNRDFTETTSSGAGVDAAVHAVASAVRSAARLASSSSISAATSAPLTRRPTNEENRTKL